jgi:hypothetical protein
MYTLSKRKITTWHMVLCEVLAVLNSRRFCSVSDGPYENMALTPVHFWIPNIASAFLIEQIKEKLLLHHWVFAKRFSDELWLR